MRAVGWCEVFESRSQETPQTGALDQRVLVPRMTWKTASLGQTDTHQPEESRVSGLLVCAETVDLHASGLKRQWQLSSVSEASSRYPASQLATTTASATSCGTGERKSCGIASDRDR